MAAAHRSTAGGSTSSSPVAAGTAMPTIGSSVATTVSQKLTPPPRYGREQTHSSPREATAAPASLATAADKFTSSLTASDQTQSPGRAEDKKRLYPERPGMCVSALNERRTGATLWSLPGRRLQTTAAHRSPVTGSPYQDPAEPSGHTTDRQRVAPTESTELGTASLTPSPSPPRMPPAQALESAPR